LPVSTQDEGRREPVDFHIHTALSPCAAKHGERAQLGTYVARARGLGWRHLCISDHVVEDDTQPWMPAFYRGCNERLVDQTRRLAAEVDGDLEVLVGVEADMVDGDRIGASAEMAQRLDFLILPPNHFHMSEHVQPASTSPVDVARHLYEHTRGAVQPWVDILAHPFVVFRQGWPPIGEYMKHVPEQAWAEVFGQMAQHPTALEVNLHCVLNPEYLAATGHLFRLAIACGVQLSYGSDAHHVGDLGRFRADVLPHILALGLAEHHFATPETFRAKRTR